MRKYLESNKEIIFSFFPKFKKELSFLSLGLLILFIPALIHNQLLTGPIINALLLLTAIINGPVAAISLGLVPSTVALSSGLLPLSLAPMVPFIMISNTIYVGIFSKLQKKNFVLGVLVSSIAKFLFLVISVTFLGSSLLNEKILSKAVTMMTWPQLITALAGGFITYIILKLSKKA
ncbi:MAG: iron hydrogenase [bacterium]